jgi:hypothetical protein
VSVRDRTRLLGLASLSIGVAFLAIYAASSSHPLYRLVVGILALALGASNLAMARRPL